MHVREGRLIALKRLVIVGAGGFGREILSWVEDVPVSEKFQVMGFLDDNPRALDGYNYPVCYRNYHDYQPREDEFLVMGIRVPSIGKVKDCLYLTK